MTKSGKCRGLPFGGFVLRWLICMGLAGAAGTVHAQAHVSATVGGQIAPGVYGRVDVSNGPVPALMFAQPVVVAPAPAYQARAPIYMYVPSGHAKHWSKHCARYAACGQPVYFVKEPPRRGDHFHGRRDRHGAHRHDGRRDHRHDGDHRRHDRGHDREHERGHGRH